MQLESLLLSQDEQVIKTLRRVLDDLGIVVEVYSGADLAAEHIQHRKFDAVIVDCDDVHGAKDVLRGVRTSPSNRSSTAFAIINGGTSVRDAFALGANLALEKPLSFDRARHSFRAAHGLMMMERRRYYRFPIEMPVTLKFGEVEFSATASNLSEGGMAVYATARVPHSRMLGSARFTLPGGHTLIAINCTICWADEFGQAGLRFESPSYSAREQLQGWLRQQIVAEKRPAPPATGAR